MRWTWTGAAKGTANKTVNESQISPNRAAAENQDWQGQAARYKHCTVKRPFVLSVRAAVGQKQYKSEHGTRASTRCLCMATSVKALQGPPTYSTAKQR